MKLLFDQNLPSSLVVRFGAEFPGSQHVKFVGLDTATDWQVWNYARQNDFAIMSKDSDFHHLSFLHGAPPKTIWLRTGNASVASLLLLIAGNLEHIAKFLSAGSEALLIISRPDHA